MAVLVGPATGVRMETVASSNRDSYRRRDEVSGIRTDRIVVNALRTLALEEGHGFDALELPMNDRNRTPATHAIRTTWSARGKLAGC